MYLSAWKSAENPFLQNSLLPIFFLFRNKQSAISDWFLAGTCSLYYKVQILTWSHGMFIETLHFYTPTPLFFLTKKQQQFF